MERVRMRLELQLLRRQELQPAQKQLQVFLVRAPVMETLLSTRRTMAPQLPC